MIEWLEKIFAQQHHHTERLEHIERNQEQIMANLKDLNDAIAALPQRIADDVIPLIPIPPAGGGPTGDIGDTTAQIEALNLVPSQVSSLVQAAIAAGAPPAPAPEPQPVDTTPADTPTA